MIQINAYNAKRYLDRLTGQLYEWNTEDQTWDTVGDPGVLLKLWPLADVLDEGNDGDGQLVKNIADPLDPQDAATKAYVDAVRAEIIAMFGAVAGQATSEFVFETAAAGEGNGQIGFGFTIFEWLTDATGTA